MNDLAQLLNALGLLSSGDAESSKIAVDFNFLLPVQDVENNNAQLRGIINTEPEPLDQLVQAFGETVREARKDSLQKDIAVFGDAQISFTWGLVNSAVRSRLQCASQPDRADERRRGESCEKRRAYRIRCARFQR